MPVITTITFSNVGSNTATILNKIQEVLGISGYRIQSKEKDFIIRIEGRIDSSKMEALTEFRDTLGRKGK